MTQRDPTTRRGLRAVSSGGDHYADWQSVHEDNAVWIYRTIYARVGNKPDAEDLTAEVFLAALRLLRLTVTKAEVRAYLRTTARTVLAAHWRETLGREITSIPDTQDIADQPPRPMSPSAPPRNMPEQSWLPCRKTIVEFWNCASCNAVRSRSQPRGWVPPSPTPRCCSIGHCAWPPRSTTRTRHEPTWAAPLCRRPAPGRRPKSFRPDDFEAAQIRTAIELRASRPGDDAPSQEFLAELGRRLVEQISDTPVSSAPRRWQAPRRTVLVGTSTAAAAAASPSPRPSDDPNTADRHPSGPRRDRA